jgi:uncharacterized protein YndB with AHSA1/START domain
MLREHMTTAIAGKEVNITRIIKAPRVLVWRAWTDPVQVAAWWGPQGFTNPHCVWDARPGGAILVHMRGPKDSPFDFVMPMKGKFHEVVAPERLVLTSTAMEDDDGVAQLETHNTITLQEHAEGTKLSVHAVVVKVMPAAQNAINGMQAGWMQSLEKLDAFMGEQA